MDGDVVLAQLALALALYVYLAVLLRVLARYHIRRLVSREPSLNDIFLHLYETDPSARAPALGRVEEEEPSGVAGGG